MSPNISKIKQRNTGQAGMTLIEIIIVVALMAGMMVYALPNMGFKSEASIQTKLSRLQEDIQGAYDMAVLRGVPHRLVFMLNSTEYWLEELDPDQTLVLDVEGFQHDLTADEEKEASEKFDVDFEEKYTKLAGQAIRDPETDKDIYPESPVIKAKKKLQPLRWSMVNNLEWGIRNLGPELMVTGLQAEHHQELQKPDGKDERARAIIYIFSKGYIENSVIYIGLNEDSSTAQNKEPWTLTINPYSGQSELVAGHKDVDVHADESYKN